MNNVNINYVHRHLNSNVVSTQGNKDVQLSVSTMCTSTKTSDYHSTQSTEAEPQKSAGLSESKTEASSSTKISGYYSDQSDPAEASRPTVQYQTGVFLWCAPIPHNVVMYTLAHYLIYTLMYTPCILCDSDTHCACTCTEHVVEHGLDTVLQLLFLVHRQSE